MYLKGISSRSVTNVSSCGGNSKSGLVPRHGQMVSGVRKSIVKGKQMEMCVAPKSNAYYRKTGNRL
jgi:hypothetical protein